jgi:hypothetical protein
MFLETMAYAIQNAVPAITARAIPNAAEGIA